MEDVDDPGQLVLGADRDVHGDTLRRELRAESLERAEEVAPLAVEHVHEDDAREAELIGKLPRPRGADLDAHDAGDSHEEPFDDPRRCRARAPRSPATSTPSRFPAPGARPPLPGLLPEDDRLYIAWVQWPNVFVNLLPDHVIVHTLLPAGPDRSRVVCDWLFAAEEVAKPGFDPTDTVDVFDITNARTGRSAS